jgi:hypothetical protein
VGLAGRSAAGDHHSDLTLNPQERSTPAALIGDVQAPDAEQAVREAIARYGISNPQEEVRLAAHRVKRLNSHLVSVIASR